MIARTSTRLSILVALALAALCPTLSAEAEATCLTSPLKNRLALTQAQFGGRDAAQGTTSPDGGPAWIVGMWMSEFLVGEALYDQTLQQFHSDGTENILSNGLPPALGNVCFGIWKQIGSRTIKLRHLAWNWTADGQFAGLFQMIVILEVDPRGGQYAGTFVADSYDLSNNVIPGLHVEGTVRGARITVD